MCTSYLIRMTKVCVVIGVGPGLGLACVRKWASQGYHVAMICRNAGKLASVETASSVKAFSADVTDPEGLTAVLKQVEAAMGEVDTVVYNCGMAVWANYLSVTHEKLDMSFKTQVGGLLTVAQHLGPKMAKRGQGCIAVTGAPAALRGRPMTPAFAASKAAQRMMVRHSLSQCTVFTYYYTFYILIINIRFFSWPKIPKSYSKFSFRQKYQHKRF